MFQRHVSERLAALVDGELSAPDALRATAHLAGCTHCRDARDRHAFAARMVVQLPVVEAPASIWMAIERAQIGEARDAGPLWRPRRVLALAAAIALVTLGVTLWQLARPSPRWEVVRLDGPAGPSPMTPGEWIETGDAASARIKIGDIGTVDIAPNTRMQLLVARRNEHRLNLPRGTISAEILAPPRLFFVETPSSTVVDLGCAYTMTVDEAGVGTLRVTSGWASLEWGGRESLVPAGASCPTRPEVGPGTPAFEDATDALRRALLAFDFAGGGNAALDTVLAEARARDTLTLWHLLSRVDGTARRRVFERLVELTPLPAGVERDKALALDVQTLKLWREELAWTW